MSFASMNYILLYIFFDYEDRAWDQYPVSGQAVKVNIIIEKNKVQFVELGCL